MTCEPLSDLLHPKHCAGDEALVPQNIEVYAGLQDLVSFCRRFYDQHGAGYAGKQPLGSGAQEQVAQICAAQGADDDELGSRSAGMFCNAFAGFAMLYRHFGAASPRPLR